MGIPINPPASASLATRIDLAFVNASIARQQDTAQSDVDLMIVSSSLAYGELFGALESATVALSRKVNAPQPPYAECANAHR